MIYYNHCIENLNNLNKITFKIKFLNNKNIKVNLKYNHLNNKNKYNQLAKKNKIFKIKIQLQISF